MSYRIGVAVCALLLGGSSSSQPKHPSSKPGSKVDGGNSGGAAGAAASGSTEYTDAGQGSVPVLPFAADSPAVYLAKIKNVLLGLAPTDDEITRVTGDP